MNITIQSKPSGDGFLPARKVWERYGVTAMTLYRWIADDRLNFPGPHYFGRFRFWKIAELEAWEQSQPRRRAAADSSLTLGAA